MTRHVASKGGKVLYVLTMQDEDSLLEEASNIGLPIDELVRDGNIRIKRCGELADSNEAQQYLFSLHPEMEKFRPGLIIIDELTDLLAHLETPPSSAWAGR